MGLPTKATIKNQQQPRFFWTNILEAVKQGLRLWLNFPQPKFNYIKHDFCNCLIISCSKFYEKGSCSSEILGFIGTLKVNASSWEHYAGSNLCNMSWWVALRRLKCMTGKLMKQIQLMKLMECSTWWHSSSSLCYHIQEKAQTYLYNKAYPP